MRRLTQPTPLQRKQSYFTYARSPIVSLNFVETDNTFQVGSLFTSCCVSVQLDVGGGVERAALSHEVEPVIFTGMTDRYGNNIYRTLTLQCFAVVTCA